MKRTTKEIIRFYSSTQPHFVLEFAMNSLSPLSVLLPAPSTSRGQSTKLTSNGANLIAFTCNKVAIVQNLNDSSALPLTFHSTSNSIVAAISPSQQCLAVGEVNGTVKIIDLTSETKKVAFEFKLGGKVNDIAWDGESQRIAFVGEGKESFGAIYSLATGTQVGEISGHSKAIQSVYALDTPLLHVLIPSEQIFEVAATIQSCHRF